MALAALAWACATPVDPQGSWGGEHVLLEVGQAESVLDFDCAAGRIAEAFQLGPEGRFDLAGVFVPGHGGPVREGEKPDEQPARYRGQIRGSTMELEVRVTANDQRIGPFQLEKGKAARVFKCL